jgi:hypothetical protein
MIFSFSVMCLISTIIILIILPISRADTRVFIVQYTELQRSVENMSKTEGYEKASIYREVIEANTRLAQKQYFAGSDWVSGFYDPKILEVKPIRFEEAGNKREQ